MFTGIINAKTQINNTKKLKDGLEVDFKTPSGWDDLVLGESIAVNGVCLTVASMSEYEWTVLLMPETLAKTSFQKNMPKIVNLERAMPLTERLSGHIVQGHVDGVGKVVKVDPTSGYTISIEFPIENASLVIYKGSITIDGVSLTVTSCKENVLSVALIPHTLETTTLGSLQPDDFVNLEFDVIGKYVAKFLTVEKAHAKS
jgi:riboflavin synthase